MFPTHKHKEAMKASSRRKLVLASTSPRRKQLLRETGLTFDVVPPRPEAECGLCSGESPPEMVLRLARAKAHDVLEQLRATAPEGPLAVLACDTVAVCCGQVLGKPRDRDDARRMLQLLSGRKHYVYSGVCLALLPEQKEEQLLEKSTLVMDPLDLRQIEEYLDTGLWEGKAGAFGLQDRPGWLRIVEGSESNVVGLPVEAVMPLLGRWGVEPAGEPDSASTNQADL